MSLGHGVSRPMARHDLVLHATRATAGGAWSTLIGRRVPTMTWRLRAAAFLTIAAVLTVGCDSDLARPAKSSTSGGELAVQTNTIPASVYGSLSGGGQNREGQWKISFAGQTRGHALHAPVDRTQNRWEGHNPRGQWTVQFHEVSEPAVSGGTFKSTSMETIVFGLHPTPDPTCVGASTITASGRFNGSPGWATSFHVTDHGSRGRSGLTDRVRVALRDPGGTEVYDSEASGDFPLEGGCLGPHKNHIEAGNLTVRIDT